VAGNEQHAALLMQQFPEIVSAECDGDGNFATVRLTGEDTVRHTRCPGCERDKIARRIGTFIPPRFASPVPLPGPVAEWAAKGHDAEGLYLSGQVGTGKTHAAWTAVTEWCIATGTVPHTPRETGVEGWSTAGPTVIFARMVDLLDDFRPGGESVQRVRDCQRAHLLVIDDLGAEKPSEWTQERLYSVIDHRYANCMPLLVTGNIPPRQLAEQTGDRVASRLAEMCTVVPMTGTDRRRPAA
jgi:DNA replication protein DnaC